MHSNHVQEVFGEMLVVAPLDKNEKELPSPDKLRRCINLSFFDVNYFRDEKHDLPNYAILQNHILNISYLSERACSYFSS